MYEDFFYKLIIVFFLSFSGIILRQTLIFSKQNWLNNFTHFLTFALLPVVTYVISSVISGNIALSLGMVGALSIVRFRNPVKSPLELVSYFALITLGIASSVSVVWSLFLIVVLEIIIISIIILNKISTTYFGRSLYKPSFIEGNQLSTVELNFNADLNDEFSDNSLLVYSSYSDNEYTYRFASNNKQHIIELINNYRDNNNLASYSSELI